MLSVAHPFSEELGRDRRDLEAEQILDLLREDDERDAAGESGGHRERNELDHPAKPRQSDHDENDPGHQRRDHEAVDAVLGDDPGDEHHERARGPADLNPRAAEGRNEEAGNNPGIETALRRDPARDGKGDAEWQGHHAHNDAGQGVGRKLLSGVAFERRGKFWEEHRGS